MSDIRPMTTASRTQGAAGQVAAIEAAMAELDTAFAASDMARVDVAAQALQRALADALVAFRQVARTGGQLLDPDTLRRLQLAQARVQAQQAAVVRAQASIERTLGVLLPREEGSTYGQLGPSSASSRLAQAYR